MAKEIATQGQESTRKLKFEDKDEAERVLAITSGKENQLLEEVDQQIQDANEQQKLMTAPTQEGKGITKQIKEAIDRETVTRAYNEQTSASTRVSGNKEHQVRYTRVHEQ